MKAATDIEFILSAFVFLGTVVFVSMSVVRVLPTLQERSLSENLQSTSYQISDLILGKGYPENWHTLDIDSVSYIGLESSDYVLDSAKVSRVAELCSNPSDYNKLREKMMNNDFIIVINGSTEILNCEPPILSLLRPRFVTVRHAIYNGNPVDLSVVILG